MLDALVEDAPIEGEAMDVGAFDAMDAADAQRAQGRGHGGGRGRPRGVVGGPAPFAHRRAIQVGRPKQEAQRARDRASQGPSLADKVCQWAFGLGNIDANAVAHRSLNEFVRVGLEELVNSHVDAHHVMTTDAQKGVVLARVGTSDRVGTMVYGSGGVHVESVCFAIR